MTTGLILKPKLPTSESELTPVGITVVVSKAVTLPTLDVALSPAG